MNNEDALNLLETDHFLQIENTKELQKIHLVHVCAFQIIQSLAKKKKIIQMGFDHYYVRKYRKHKAYTYVIETILYPEKNI